MKIIFDASAVIAWLKGERGAEVVAKYVQQNRCRRYIHAINYCEVYAFLLRNIADEKIAVSALASARTMVIEDMCPELCLRAARLRAAVLNLSIPDCFALAFSEKMKAPVLTSDRGFCKAENISGSKIILIR